MKELEKIIESQKKTIADLQKLNRDLGIKLVAEQDKVKFITESAARRIGQADQTIKGLDAYSQKIENGAIQMVEMLSGQKQGKDKFNVHWDKYFETPLKPRISK